MLMTRDLHADGPGFPSLPHPHTACIFIARTRGSFPTQHVGVHTQLGLLQYLIVSNARRALLWRFAGAHDPGFPGRSQAL